MSAAATACALVACALGALIAAALHLWVSRPRTAIPGPPTIPVIGNLLIFRKTPVVLEDFKELQKVYGNLFRFYIGPVLFVVVTEAEDSLRVLSGSKLRDRGPYLAQAMRPFGGNGLITSCGEVWRTHRKLIEPCFHSEVLKRFCDAYNEGAQYICNYLTETKGSQVELHNPLCLLAMHTLAASVFGLPFEEMAPDRDMRDKMGDSLLVIFHFIQLFVFRPWLRSEFVMWVTRLRHKFITHNTVVVNLVKRGIEYKKTNKDNRPLTKRKALLDTLIGSEQLMTDEEIYDEIRTFMIAGVDTVACAMGYALVLLSLHPEWQDAAQKELDAVFGNGEDYLRPSTPEDLAQLPVIESTIKETLRLYSTAPFAPVILPEDTPLAGGRYVAPRGSNVLVSLHLLHRQPDAFQDPDKFDPSRFLGGGGPAGHRGAYLPFGAGSRKCVGERFAMLEMKTVLAAVMRRFRLLPGCTRQQLDHVGLSAASVPLNGFKVTCIPRTDLPMSQEN